MAHPLLDRRDLTAQRDPRNSQSAGESYYAELCAELAETNRLLREVVGQQRADIAQLCVTDREPAQQVMENFPTVGARRMITRRTGSGASVVLAANVAQTVLQPREDRLGGLIVNAGANPVTLSIIADLTDSTGTPLTGAPQIVLPANASWDLLLGRLVWCGSVIAKSAVGSTLSVAEV